MPNRLTPVKTFMYYRFSTNKYVSVAEYNEAVNKSAFRRVQHTGLFIN